LLRITGNATQSDNSNSTFMRFRKGDIGFGGMVDIWERQFSDAVEPFFVAFAESLPPASLMIAIRGEDLRGNSVSTSGRWFGGVFGVVGMGELSVGLKVAKGGSLIKQSGSKSDILFSNRCEALNWSRNQLGHSTEKLYNSSGKWIGWSSFKGSVYWGHGDWGKGLGTSTFPHLNYKIGSTRGHLFLQDKIINRGMWDEFVKSFGK